MTLQKLIILGWIFFHDVLDAERGGNVQFGFTPNKILASFSAISLEACYGWQKLSIPAARQCQILEDQPHSQALSPPGAWQDDLWFIFRPLRGLLSPPALLKPQ